MIQVTLNLNEEETKSIFKQALAEMLAEKNEMIYDALAEVLEDMALARAIAEGETTETVSREELFQIFAGVD
jgi:hypothetical protein